MNFYDSIVYHLWKFLDSHEKLNYIRFCCQYINKPKYVKTLIGKNENVLFIDHMGDENPNNLVYFIDGVRKGDGFFAEYRRTLNYLYYADKHGLLPVVYYSSDYLYAERETINGYTNPYEYYYKQPVGISVDSALTSCNVVRNEFAHSFYAEHLKVDENGYVIEDKYIAEMAKIAQKYIRYEDNMMKYLDDSSRDILHQQKVLGVHYRGGDFKKNFKNHPSLVSLDEYADEINKALEEKQFDKIFVATDDSEALSFFEQKYGDLVLSYSDVIRTKNDESVAFSENERVHHHYLLGREVLRDMYTLAQCDGLIAGRSQVSICTLIEKKKNQQEYRYIKIIDKGLSNNNKIYVG